MDRERKKSRGGQNGGARTRLNETRLLPYLSIYLCLRRPLLAALLFALSSDEAELRGYSFGYSWERKIISTLFGRDEF